jgi:hypothetical protein
VSDDTKNDDDVSITIGGLHRLSHACPFLETLRCALDYEPDPDYYAYAVFDEGVVVVETLALLDVAGYSAVAVDMPRLTTLVLVGGFDDRVARRFVAPNLERLCVDYRPRFHARLSGSLAPLGPTLARRYPKLARYELHWRSYECAQAYTSMLTVPAHLPKLVALAFVCGRRAWTPLKNENAPNDHYWGPEDDHYWRLEDDHYWRPEGAQPPIIRLDGQMFGYDQTIVAHANLTFIAPLYSIERLAAVNLGTRILQLPMLPTLRHLDVRYSKWDATIILKCAPQLETLRLHFTYAAAEASLNGNHTNALRGKVGALHGKVSASRTEYGASCQKVNAQHPLWPFLRSPERSCTLRLLWISIDPIMEPFHDIRDTVDGNNKSIAIDTVDGDSKSIATFSRCVSDLELPVKFGKSAALAAIDSSHVPTSK